MRYFGIDVGDSKYFIVWYSSNDRIVHSREEPLTTTIEALRFVSPTDSIIAIDAPSDVCKCINGQEKRLCEEDLCIVGRFQTPCSAEKARPWMRSGFNLWRKLEKNGFKRAIETPLRAGDLIEVHPTIIFKQVFLKDNNVEPILWIHQKEPPNKRKSEGKKDRRNWLVERFKGQSNAIERMNIDNLDALIAAYTAEHAQRSFGDKCDGQIWFPGYSSSGI